MPDVDYDVVVVGAGPNGLAAAITLARAGRSVCLYEAQPTVGGGARSAELTLPGFLHDVCSAIHPLAVASPFFRTIPLESLGVEWIHPSAALAHPLDDGTAAVLYPSIDTTAETLGPDDQAWRELMEPFVENGDKLIQALLGPLRFPRHPLVLARFGLPALRSAVGLARSRFTSERARAMFSGMAAHSMLDLYQPTSAAIGLVLGLGGHLVGWPLPRLGTQRISDALAACLRSLGGEIVTERPVTSLQQLPSSRAVVFDVTPRQLLDITGDALPSGYRRQLSRFRYGPGVVKVDYALDGPVPWRARECFEAATVHVGGTMDEIAASERAVTRGEHPERPFVLVAQQSLFDPTRAPEGKHTLWAYCHVPNGSTVDISDRIDAQIERFAPGFRERVLARNVMLPAEMQCYNANYIGGDINGGIQDMRQLFTRPAVRLDPYTTPNSRLYLCSSSTPPGGGVHGMCGYHAAQSVLRRLR